ncbi:MAG: hypothetical protein JNJ82_12545 [Opitutaceae bacterium]|nr:hypothetical protein [Opitutaceae bacterium]
MITSLISTLASVNPVPVPDSGSTGMLLGAAAIGAGLLARYFKNRKS